ncbi:MAG TPA: carbohydrate ABC transporter permease [Candidatus Alectryocaccomicrobium excrementavium]|uniref:Carbohydrate ABC transporter permease n=1 Tax=Candidatus Alectryocaccomicrobium excrementavium TaxID=2840668 RepID=A0A9D1G122_9FIRM|nr:carbohydrate ABC transporter permease [Candidatus Alectryocaccomicrobium excrementavium]
MKRTLSDKTFDWINGAILFALTLIFLYPLYFVLIASISEPYEVVQGNVLFWPRGFTLTAYQNVLRESSVWTGYRNSIFYTLLGTAYNLVLTIPAAYVLTKQHMPGRGLLTAYFFITMYFSGGMIPTYIIIRELNLINTPWVLIIGTGVSCWNLLVTRQFFSSTIPLELYESAEIDGANEFRMFFRIALPLAAPIVAVMALFYAVGHWNSYYNALLYVRTGELYPLQLVLRNILISNEMMLANAALEGDAEAMATAARRAYMAEAMKYALIFIAAAPMLCIYPFVQKHFVKGVMIGAIKG